MVRCKWINRVKEVFTVFEYSRFKVRLVTKGHALKEGIDFKEIFSPIVRYASIRILLALTAVYD